MFNRSIKYIILLFLNIILLFVLYFNQDKDQVGVFDTQFVINLLEERDQLQNALIDAEMAQIQAEKTLRRAQTQAGESDAISHSTKQAYLQCESARLNAERLVREQKAQLEIATTPVQGASCEEQTGKLNLARQRLAAAQVDTERYKERIAELEQLLVEASQENDVSDLVEQIEALQLENRSLKADIEDPIYLKSVYISGRKCQKPDFDELVCIQELLVRPQFSKAPTTDVVVSVYSPDDRKLASASFSSKRAQLFRLPLGRGQEVPAGEFRASFEVEGELLSSQGHIISHN